MARWSLRCFAQTAGKHPTTGQVYVNCLGRSFFALTDNILDFNLSAPLTEEIHGWENGPLAKSG